MVFPFEPNPKVLEVIRIKCVIHNIKRNTQSYLNNCKGGRKEESERWYNVTSQLSIRNGRGGGGRWVGPEHHHTPPRIAATSQEWRVGMCHRRHLQGAGPVERPTVLASPPHSVPTVMAALRCTAAASCPECSWSALIVFFSNQSACSKSITYRQTDGLKALYYIKMISNLQQQKNPCISFLIN